MPVLRSVRKTVVIANGAAVSGGFVVEPWAMFYGAYFPSMDAGNIGIALTIDGTNYNPILDPADGADAVLVASGSDPGWVDFSDWVRFVPEKIKDAGDVMLRFTCAAQGALRTVTIIMRG